jgi:hypothetical protein
MRERCRFKLYGVGEVCRMSPAEWEEECRRNGADMEESPEEGAVRNLVAK